MKEQRQPLDGRLARRATDTFVGREREMEILQCLLADDGPLVVHLFGIPGTGKSTLLANFLDQAEGKASVLMMDCGQIEPTERGFLGELSRLSGVSLTTIDEAVALLERSDRPFILGLDHYETFLLMDTWLRQIFLPALPGSCRLVIASRQQPVPLWTTSPSWLGLFRTVAVEPLDQAASRQLLTDAGLGEAEAEALATVTHGNPLALKLAASAALAQDTRALQDAAIPEVMQTLTSLFLADVDEPVTRDAVHCTSVARRITRPLLASLGFDDGAVFERLRQLPFVSLWRDGLRVHDAVREAAAQTLRVSDPGRHAGCRLQTWRQLRRELATAPRTDIWRYTADMLYLIENPVIREAFFPSDRQTYAVEEAGGDDLGAILEIIHRHDGEAAADIFEQWWIDIPGAFRVVRDREGRVVAFYCMCEPDDLTDEILDADPVAAAWDRHLAEDPAERKARVLLLRRWLGAEAGEAPSSEQAACWLDIKRTYMELRPDLQRVYLTVVDLPVYAPVAVQLGFRHLADSSVDLGGMTFQSALLDFGFASVDGWITRLVGDELGVRDPSPVDHQRRAVVLDGEEIALTPLEFKLAEHLERTAGATATREDLLERVWGHEDGGGSSNVVDAVVKSLRRKLGPEAGRLETVRGFGYRWRQD